MSFETAVVACLGAALAAVMAAGGIAISAERRRHEKEEERIRREGEENARRNADIITEAEKIKSNASTGNHSDDLHTMADQLHHYAHGGK